MTDHSRLEFLVNTYEDALYRAALAILGDRCEAEDAVQDAFLRCWEKAPEFETPEHARAWLLRVLVNGCKSRLRLAWRRVGPLPETLPAPGPEEREELEELFSLPPEDRAVIHLHYYEGYSTEEIAGLLSCRPGTVRSRLFRARERLKKLLVESQRGEL